MVAQLIKRKFAKIVGSMPELYSIPPNPNQLGLKMMG